MAGPSRDRRRHPLEAEVGRTVEIHTGALRTLGDLPLPLYALESGWDLGTNFGLRSSVGFYEGNSETPQAIMGIYQNLQQTWRTMSLAQLPQSKVSNRAKLNCHLTKALPDQSLR